MYAVFQIGKKQYRATEGQIIRVERIKSNIGDRFECNQVLFIKNENFVRIGNPFIDGAKIIAKVFIHSFNKKIKIIKFRRRKHFRKFQGHRQIMTNIKVISINISDLERINQYN